MSVRDCLLAVLSLGPQYGLQIHAELTTRTPHRAATNVGQIYSTLERLVRDERVETAGQTDDGLPLYQLTATGANEATAWLNSTSVKSDTSWPDILDLAFMVRSLPHVDPHTALTAISRSFAPRAASASGTDAKSRTAGLLEKAEQDFASGVRSVVDRLTADVDSSPEHGWGLTNVRPKRGRRPLNPPS